MKRIPKSFQLGGYTVTVRQVDARLLEQLAGEPCYGLFLPDELSIYLSKPTRALKASVVLQTFFHEMFHAFCWAANHMQDNEEAEERLVDQFGHFLHQATTSAKY